MDALDPSVMLSPPQPTLITNVWIVNEGDCQKGALLTDAEGRIAHVTLGDTPSFVVPEGVRHFHAPNDDYYLLPGLIDTHVHFREPGLEHKGTLATESKAAVAGGVTSFFDMPNTLPLCDTLQQVDAKLQLAQGKSYANYAFYLGATQRNIEQVARAHTHGHIPAVKLFMGASTGNMVVNAAEVLEAIFERVRLPLALHCEDDALMHAAQQKLNAQYAQAIPFTEHHRARPVEACVASVRMALEYAQRYNTRLHFLHISSEEELALLQPAQATQLPYAQHITMETCPHYLTFTNEDYARLQGKIKCNPSIKTLQDREALRQALAQGVITTLGSDHAPHTLQEKDRPYAQCPSGIASIQHNLPILLTLTLSTSITLATVVQAMCHNPARLFHIAQRGFLRKGYWADFLLVRYHPQARPLASPPLQSLCGWSPYEGIPVHYTVHATWVNGTLAYNQGYFGEPVGQSIFFSY